MSVSTRIEAIEQHLTDDYSVLTLAGADLTNVDKNIINLKPTWQERLLYFINNGTDVVWNNWEKVTGEGETLTLNSTEEAPMKIDLKGNTSQASYEGKNLIPTQTDLWEQGAITGSTGENSSSTTRLRTKEYYPISNDTDYYVSIQNSNYCFLNIILYDSDKGYIGQYYNISSDINGTRSKLINVPSALMPNVAYYRATVRNTNNTATIIASEIETAKPQIELGSTATDWAQYVGGVPSPNPDYPQDIHVVSGDNEIQVCGKNLFDKTTITENQRLDPKGGNNYDENCDLSDYIKIQPNTTYTRNITASVYECICFYTINKTFISRDTTHATTTSPNNAYYVRISCYKTNLDTLQFEKGSSASTYEPYQSASYPINLGVENLLQNNLTSGTNNGITYVVNEDKSVTLNGTATAITWLILNSSVTLEAGTYTMTSGYSGNDVRVYSTGLGVYTLDGQRTVTKTSSVSGDVAINIPSGTICNNLTIKPMIEKGSKANTYTPYGTTPIELCKIGDYQDSIKKSTGKNLFDISTITENTYIEENGNTGSSQVTNLSDYIEVKPNTNYTLSYDYLTLLNSNQRNFVYYDENKTYISSYIYLPVNKTNTVTTSNNAKYIRFSYDKNCYSIMLNEGTTALPYEPYGKVWYLNKQIGKVVFDGSESWSINTSYTYNVFYRTLNNYARISNAQTTYCEYYKGIENATGIADFGNNYNNSIGVRTANDNIKDIYISNNSITSVSDFKTWLSTHNTVVYYVLANPTYTEITDTTLISQLEAVKRSYDGQTNISQVNNDLPFILDVTALKQLTQ